MSDSARDVLVRGIAAAKAKENKEARFYLEWTLRLDCTLDQQIEAWYWLSEVSDDPAEKRRYLEEVLGHRPSYYPARRSLAILDGRLNPQDIVDPDHLPTAPRPAEAPAEAQRFVCPQCGGRLTYTPDGQSLTCEYCTARRRLTASPSDADSEITEADFTLALATAKGHSQPVATRSFECHSCGVSFMLSPQALSLTCPYCASVYVVEIAETRELIPPEAIIPFAISREQAQQALEKWLAAQKILHIARCEPLYGFYFPVWTFTLSGHLPWKARQYDQNKRDWLPVQGHKLVFDNSLLVPAGRALPEAWAEELDRFDLDRLIPYDAAYLANWPAETYHITLAQASLRARQQSLAKARAALPAEIFDPVRDLKIDSSALLVESFKLILLPLWVSHYHYEEESFPVLVNGQTATVRGETPAKGAQKWLSWLTAKD